MADSNLLLGCFCCYGDDVTSNNNFDIVMQRLSIIARHLSKLKEPNPTLFIKCLHDEITLQSTLYTLWKEKEEWREYGRSKDGGMVVLQGADI